MSGWEVVETEGGDRVHAAFGDVAGAYRYVDIRIATLRDDGWKLTLFKENGATVRVELRRKKERKELLVKPVR